MLQRTDGVKYIEVIRTYDAPVELKDEDDQGGYELKTLASDRLNVGDLFFPPSPSPCDVDLSLVRHNWEKRLYKTLPANPQHTKRLSNTTSLINLEHISDNIHNLTGT